MPKLRPAFAPSIFISGSNLSPLSAPLQCHQTAPRCTRLRLSPRATQSADISPPILSPNLEHYETAVGHPVVHRYISDEGSSYALWYSVASPASNQSDPDISDSIALAISDDGRSFSRVPGPLDRSAVLTPNTSDWWTFDTLSVSTGSVVVSSATRVRADAAVFYLYYYGHAAEHVIDTPQQPVTRIGLAISKDGEHFSRIEGEYPSGAVLEAADAPAFDDGLVSSPTVIQLARPPTQGLSSLLGNASRSSGIQYVMHYHGRSRGTPLGPPAIGRAVSKDGLLFQRTNGGQPVVPRPDTIPPSWAVGGVCNPCVLHRDASDASAPFLMFVEVWDLDGRRRIAACESTDCESWGELELVLEPAASGAWDDGGVAQPCVVEDELGRIRLYYVGWHEGHENASAIGLAESLGSDWRGLRRIAPIQ